MIVCTATPSVGSSVEERVGAGEEYPVVSLPITASLEEAMRAESVGSITDREGSTVDVGTKTREEVVSS